MQTKHTYGEWMATEVVKSYLLGANLGNIKKENSRKFDFVLFPIENSNKPIGIEIKGSKYPKSKLLSTYRKQRIQYVGMENPVIMFYVDYLTKRGFFEIINEELTNRLIPLNTENLKREIEKITAHNKELS